MLEEESKEIQKNDILENGKYQYAPFVVRLAAFIVDQILLSFFTFFIYLLYLGLDSGVVGTHFVQLVQGEKDFALLDYLALYIIPPLIIIYFWIAKQATPGKILFKAKIVDMDTGKPATTRQYLFRYFGFFVSMYVFFIFIWIAIDKRRQGLHDKLAGTVVIQPK